MRCKFVVSFYNLYDVTLPWHRDKHWMVVKKKWSSVRDPFDPLVVVLLNIHANVKDAQKAVGCDGCII